MTARRREASRPALNRLRREGMAGARRRSTVPALNSTSAPSSPATARLRPKGLFLLEPRFLDLVYSPAERARLEACLAFDAPPQTPGSHSTLDETRRAEVEVIVTSWSMPRVDEQFLALYPRLKAVFCGAGSARGFVTEASWARGVRVITAAAANAIPVAEFTFAHAVLALKRVWQQAAAVKADRRFARSGGPVPGAYGSTVGLIALGRIGRLTARRLQSLGVTTLAYDPCVSPEEAADVGARLVALDELFRTSDVVSCHLPLLPETERMLRAEHFRAMPPGATFINTARGQVVAEDEMIAVLRERPDLFAVLDVTDPEPPRADSTLFDLPNVALTPHLAGSLGRECWRLGESIAADVEHYVRGEPMPNEVLEGEAALMA